MKLSDVRMSTLFKIYEIKINNIYLEDKLKSVGLKKGKIIKIVNHSDSLFHLIFLVIDNVEYAVERKEVEGIDGEIIKPK